MRMRLRSSLGGAGETRRRPLWKKVDDGESGTAPPSLPRLKVWQLTATAREIFHNNHRRANFEACASFRSVERSGL